MWYQRTRWNATLTTATKHVAWSSILQLCSANPSAPWTDPVLMWTQGLLCTRLLRRNWPPWLKRLEPHCLWITYRRHIFWQRLQKSWLGTIIDSVSDRTENFSCPLSNCIAKLSSDTTSRNVLADLSVATKTDVEEIVKRRLTMLTNILQLHFVEPVESPFLVLQDTKMEAISTLKWSSKLPCSMYLKKRLVKTSDPALSLLHEWLECSDSSRQSN